MPLQGREAVVIKEHEPCVAKKYQFIYTYRQPMIGIESLNLEESIADTHLSVITNDEGMDSSASCRRKISSTVQVSSISRHERQRVEILFITNDSPIKKVEFLKL